MSDLIEWKSRLAALSPRLDSNVKRIAAILSQIDEKLSEGVKQREIAEALGFKANQFSVCLARARRYKEKLAGAGDKKRSSEKKHGMRQKPPPTAKNEEMKPPTPTPTPTKPTGEKPPLPKQLTSKSSSAFNDSVPFIKNEENK